MNQKSTSLTIARTIAYYASFIVLGLVASSLGPTLQGLAEHTGTLLSEISFVFLARSSGYLLGSILAGRVYDRLPGHWVMGGVLLLMALSAALAPVIPVLWLLAGVLLLLGIAEGMLDVGANTLLVWDHGAKVGPYMNGLHFFFGVGAFLSPIIAGWSVDLSGDINWTYWISAMAALPVGLWLLSLSSPSGQEASGDASRPAVNVTLLALIVVFFAFYVGAEISFGSWIFTYATKSGALTEKSAYVLNSIFWGALTLGRLISIPIAAKLKPRSILIGDLAGCLSGLIVILLFPGSSIAIWMGTVWVGFSMASCFPTMVSFAGQRMTTTGAVTSWFFVGASIGGMTLPWLIGQLFDSVGPRGMMVAVLIDLLLGSGVLASVILISRRLGLEAD